jgi:hypothetical protein
MEWASRWVRYGAVVMGWEQHDKRRWQSLYSYSHDVIYVRGTNVRGTNQQRTARLPTNPNLATANHQHTVQAAGGYTALAVVMSSSSIQYTSFQVARSTWLLTVHSRWGAAAESGSRAIRCAAPVIRQAFKTAYAVPDEGLATRTSWDTASGMPEPTPA